MQRQRFFSLRWAAIIGSLVIAACLTFSSSPYDTARGFSIASVSSPVSNTASKGDRLTSRHPNSSARGDTQPEQVTAKHAGKFPSGVKLPSASSLIGLISAHAAVLLRYWPLRPLRQPQGNPLGALSEFISLGRAVALMPRRPGDQKLCSPKSYTSYRPISSRRDFDAPSLTGASRNRTH